MKNIVLILCGVFLNAGAQLFMRKGMLQIGPISLNAASVKMLPKLASNMFLWLSIFCYITSALIWMIILSKVEVSFAYSFISLGFVVVVIAGYVLFNEHITLNRVAGIILISIGVIFVSKS
jgi:multidrug transporter EmrE-like cation transporter